MTKSLRLGIAGLGTVGGGVLDILGRHGALVAARAGVKIEVVAVSARDRSKKRGHDLSALTWYEDPVKLAVDPNVDVFIELIGGEGDPAKAAVETALKSGKHVITANTALLAVDADDELCAAVPLILGDAQLQHIRAAADRAKGNSTPCRRWRRGSRASARPTSS